MTYQLPEPAYETATGRTLYTVQQVQAAFDAGRAAGLEAAAKVAETAANRLGGHQFAADAIRNLKETQ